MNMLPKSDLKILLEKQKGSCVSIFIPTHRAATGAQHDRIMLRNLVRDSEKRLLELGYRSPAARKLLEPFKKFLKEDAIWQHQSDGLALFLAEDNFRYYRLPYSFKSQVVVSNRFHIKPLFTVLTADNRFYILALSQNAVKFFQCTGYGAREIQVEGMPLSMADALRYEESGRQSHFHSLGTSPSYHGSPGGVDRSKIVLGHGQTLGDIKKEDIMRFLQLVDTSLHEPLNDEKAPLLLAGVDFLLSIYRQVNKYPSLFGTEIVGNPEDLNLEELHKRAWAVIQPYFDHERTTAMSRYREAVGTRHVINDLKEAVLLSYDGRVDVMFLAEEQQRWGRFYPETRVVELHPLEESGDDDLLDIAAANALLNRGTVYLMKQDEMPDRAPVAAVLRY